MLRTLPVILVLLLVAPAFAQTSAPMNPLASFEGTYALTGAPHDVEGSYDGTLTIAPILGGRFQQWEWEMTMRGLRLA